MCVLILALRLREKVFPAGGIDEYLTSQYPDEAWFSFLFRTQNLQAAMLDFARWIDQFAPADGGSAEAYIF